MNALRLMLAAVPVLAGLAGPVCADYLGGWQAFSEGRFEDARDAWLPGARHGDADLQHYLGLLHESGRLGAVDREAAIEWYGAAAARNLPAAQVRLAYHVLHGTGTDPDPGQAIELLTRAAEQGYAPAQYNLAIVYERGIHGAPQPDLASFWYHHAALQGFPEAQYGLARMFALDNSHEQALAWYRAAAEAGLAEAQNNLAYMYEQGLGVARDFEAAVAWYRRAADQGLAVALNNLGILLQYGRGVETDLPGARRSYEAAARAGHPFAQINLATCLANGIGSRVNLVEARAWLAIASRSLDEDARSTARDFIDALAGRMDREGLRRAAHRAGFLARAIGGGDPAAPELLPPLPGELGAPVAAAQRYLVLLGYLDGAVDNIAGPMTRAAVRSFQRRAELDSDGVIGETLVTLLGNSAIPLIPGSHRGADRGAH